MVALAALVVSLRLLDREAGAAETPHRPALGINLAGAADWNTELPFVDGFRFARTWISQQAGAGWGKGPTLDLDEHGWVRRLDPGCFAETPLCTIEGGHYPSGVWTVVWDGEGRVSLSRGRVVSSASGLLKVDLEAQGGGFFLRLHETKPENPVRNLRVLMPGVTAEEAVRNPWNPTFLKRWRGMACLRFMDLQDTNGSKQRRWADRAQLTDATWTRQGVPIEWLCDLANRLEADAWFCIPHLADDAYVREFATLVRARLNPGRRVYLEYSNEVWNSGFSQQAYAAERGQSLGFAEKPWEAAWRFTAHRSVEIFKIWEEVLGGRDRLVRVLPSQAANSYVAKQVLEWKGAARQADVLAIAPYISMNVPREGKGLTAAEVATWSPDRFLDYVETNALPESIRWIEANAKVAKAHGLRLVAYEAGQHFVGLSGGENDAGLTRLLQEVNSHPRMAKLYADYFAAWERHGGDLLCHFSSVGAWSKWGSWGLLQHQDDDPRQSPKFRAVMAWGKKLGMPVTEP